MYDRDNNPLQCSCLENARDGRAWWAAVCGVAQSQTELKLLSSMIETKKEWWLPGFGVRARELLFNGYRVLVW